MSVTSVNNRTTVTTFSRAIGVAALLALIGIALAVRSNHRGLVQRKGELHQKFETTCAELQLLDAEEDKCSHAVENDDPGFPRCLELERQEFALIDELRLIVKERNAIGEELTFAERVILEFPGDRWLCHDV